MTKYSIQPIPRRLPVLPSLVHARSSGHVEKMPLRPPTYLRVIINAICPLSCTYCHKEGDPAVQGREHGLPTGDWELILRAATRAGFRKIKFLGGEPLLRNDLPKIVSAIREESDKVDISVITSGSVPISRLDELYQAGLSRVNLSIHGFTYEAFQRRTSGKKAQWAMRNQFLERLLFHKRPLKLNYVYRGNEDDADLAELFKHAAGFGLVVNVLDDLNQNDINHLSVRDVVKRLCGEAIESWVDDDPDSLPTTRLRFANGLIVEIKDTEIGQLLPWKACVGCLERQRCREGIYAIRITHTGVLRLCMLREDIGFDLFSLAGRDLQAITQLIKEISWREWRCSSS